MNISISPSPEVVTEINLGKSSPKLNGVVNISRFPALTGIVCEDNGISEFITSSENDDNLQNIVLPKNLLTGSAMQIITPNTVTLTLRQNTLNAPLSSLAPYTNLVAVDVGFNPNMGGGIPEFPDSLRIFDAQVCALTGGIPQLPDEMRRFRTVYNSLTGELPDVSNSAALYNFQAHNNDLTGPLPDFSNQNNLRILEMDGNELSDWVGGTISNKIIRMKLQNNLLPVSAVNAMLAELVAGGATNRILNIGGTGNAAPTGQGITDKNTLISRGWSITTN